MGAMDVYYVRYMDDILVLTKTRWHLRRAVRILNQTFAELKLAQHPDKTFIGRIEKGFDFLGYHFTREGLTVGRKTLEKFAGRLARLYERKREGLSSPSALGSYVRRWLGWAIGGLESAKYPVPVNSVPFTCAGVGEPLPTLPAQARAA